MIYGYGRQAVWAGALLLLLLLQGTRLWAAERTVTGVVVKSGSSGVIVRASGSSTAVKYHTGRKTVYSPANYRPGPGDTVTVRFHGKRRANGREFLVASALALVNQAPARPAISSPAVGIVWKVGRKRIKFAFLGNGQIFTMEMTRNTRKSPEHWRPRAGDKVRVFYDRVPARFVRKTVLVIRRLEKLE